MKQLTNSPVANGDMVLPQASRLVPGIGQRIISAIILASLALLYIIAGGWYFSALVMVICGVLAYEWVGLMRPDTRRHRHLIFAVLLLVMLVLVVGATLSTVGTIFLTVCAAVALLVALTALIRSRYLPIILGGVIYIGMPALSLLWLRHEQGAEALLVIWLFVIVWTTDTGAFLVGSLLGGHKLAPRISPGKTWSGAFGGVASAALIGALISFALGGNLVMGAAIAGLISILAQIGDLFESVLKRRAQVKHSGVIIPGHGGMMDRLDGLMFAAPAMAILMHLVDPNLVG